MNSPQLSVVGLGKLGACLAASLAHCGYDVTGVDIDESVVDQIESGEAPFPEPHLQEYLNTTDTLSATTDTRAAVHDTDISYVVVNTPSTDDHRYSLDYVNAVCNDIGEALSTKDDYHVVVITSTVFPGSTMGEVRTRLETASGKTAGEGFGLCYSPEFIAIGDVIRGLEDPDFFLLGEGSERAGDVVTSVYESLGEESTPIARMTPTDAEITKMAVNSYVTMKISFVNTLAEICDGVGGHVDTVTDALQMDGRINGNYLRAGTRFGGPCFPRDNLAFGKLAADAKTDAPLARATDIVNDQHTHWIADIVRDVTNPGDEVGILGLSYKPGTYITEESQGMELIAELADEYTLSCFDPMGLEGTRERVGETVQYAESSEALLDSVDCVVVTVPWDGFLETSLYANRTVTLVDPWRFIEQSGLDNSVTYVPVGARRVATENCIESE